MDIAIYLLFLLWTGAGLADFALHRRSDLAHTSGLTESSLHLAQLSVMALAVLIWWALRPTWAAWGAVAALVMVHALVGYADTRSAWHKRDITPLEQHVHSVLDAVPWVLLAWYATTLAASGPLLAWQPRPAQVWLWMGLPAAAVVLCALGELYSAWRARLSA
ncbi:MAG TPA: hypothetical protein VIP30_07225 [Stenotrophomonas sp.]